MTTEPTEPMYKLPIPTPMLTDEKSTSHLLHQQATSVISPEANLVLSVEAYCNFHKIMAIPFSMATRDAFVAQSAAGTKAHGDALALIPSPDMIPGGHDPSAQMFLPYALLSGLNLIMGGVAAALQEKTVVERYAFISEFVRQACLYGAWEHLRNNGISDHAQINNVAGMRVLIAPDSAGIVALTAMSREMMANIAASTEAPVDAAPTEAAKPKPKLRF